jgi:hypothetical protein
VARVVHSASWHTIEEHRMHWIRVTNPQYEQSQKYAGQVGEVVGRWGPENSADSRDGYLVEFPDGEIVGITENEVEAAENPAAPKQPGKATGRS